MSRDDTDAAYEKAAEQSPGDGESRHNVEDCPGEFRSMYNPGDSPLGGPSAMICASCGATRPIEDFGAAEVLEA